MEEEKEEKVEEEEKDEDNFYSGGRSVSWSFIFVSLVKCSCVAAIC